MGEVLRLARVAAFRALIHCCCHAVIDHFKFYRQPELLLEVLTSSLPLSPVPVLYLLLQCCYLNAF